MKPQFLGAVLLVFNTGLAAAAEESWFRYENPHFTALSNAPEKQTRQILLELETFRAGFLQVSNVETPASAPKTVVLITANKKQFKQIAVGKNTAGFAFESKGRTFIVMPAAGGKKWSSTVVRHEYGHVLLRYKEFPYPAWYEEGFAELASSMELTNKGASFIIGKPPDRARHNGPPLMEWDVLVSDEFRPHEITDLQLVSSAYAQAWLLAHYATLGNDLRNARRLQAYFDLLKEGAGSLPAFEEAFGATPNDLWKGELEPYTKRIPGYTFTFRPAALQTAFSRDPASDSDTRPLLEYLRLRALATSDVKPPKDALAILPGAWSPLSLDAVCEPVSLIKVDSGAARITVETDHRDGTVPDMTTFRYEGGNDGQYQLTALADQGADAEADDKAGETDRGLLVLKVKAADLFCWGRTDGSRTPCSVPMRKCSNEVP